MPLTLGQPILIRSAKPSVNIRQWKEWLIGQARAKSGTSEQPAPAADAGAARLDTVFGALIMMVDDEPLAIEVTQVHLQEAGFTRFVSTSDPREALALITAKRPDVLLLDLSMPDVSGFDILARMEARNILKDVPTIVVTASTDSATKLKALEHGVTEFLTKPVDPIELVLRVSNTLAAKAYWQGCWAAR